MRVLLIVLFPFFVYADIPAKNYTDWRAVVLGVVGVSFKQIKSFTACVQEDIYNQKPMMELVPTITACATTGFGAATLTGWGITVLPQLELCLQGAGTSTISIGTKAAAVLVPEVLVFYNNVMSNFTSAKALKKNHDKVLNGGYQMINKRYTRDYVNVLCMKVARNVTSKQVKCVFDNLKKIVDFTTYPCYMGTKSNLLG